MIRNALIVEDLPDSLCWLTGVAQAAFPGIDIRTAGTVAEAGAALGDGHPDLALVDLGLPDGEGADIIRRLNRDAPDTWCVVTTVFDDDAHLFSALQAGAHGYLLKDQAQDTLVRMLQGITSGQPPLSPAIARRLLAHFQQLAPQAGKPTAGVPLSPRETEVLRLIAKGFTTQRAAGILGVAASTIAGYTKDLYRKLNVSSRAEATMEAVRRGLVRPD